MHSCKQTSAKSDAAKPNTGFVSFSQVVFDSPKLRQRCMTSCQFQAIAPLCLQLNDRQYRVLRCYSQHGPIGSRAGSWVPPGMTTAFWLAPAAFLKHCADGCNTRPEHV